MRIEGGEQFETETIYFQRVNKIVEIYSTYNDLEKILNSMKNILSTGYCMKIN